MAADLFAAWTQGAFGANLTDVTCGAAETSHFFNSQYNGVPPQLDALSKSTQLVTMTIGGNDEGVFIDAIVACGSAGLSTAGQGSPCRVPPRRLSARRRRALTRSFRGLARWRQRQASA